MSLKKIRATKEAGNILFSRLITYEEAKERIKVLEQRLRSCDKALSFYSQARETYLEELEALKTIIEENKT
ncbi:MAG: hypothetical protein QMD10_07810 [Desulfitobacteriaceae bacterium]|nr:hypothetical protein [Desulfitobacteriaceae bacterium]